MKSQTCDKKRSSFLGNSFVKFSRIDDFNLQRVIEAGKCFSSRYYNKKRLGGVSKRAEFMVY